MDKPCFIRLTRTNNAAYRENFANVRRYYPANEGTQIEYFDGVTLIVQEKPDQIDSLLGTLTHDSKRIDSKTTKL